MSTDVLVYWFRSDLRLGDNPALHAACASAGRLLPVYCHDPAEDAALPPLPGADIQVPLAPPPPPQ